MPPLTDRERRMISSPASLSPKQRRNARYRMRRKIRGIMHDALFILENRGAVTREFGDDIISMADLRSMSGHVAGAAAAPESSTYATGKDTGSLEAPGHAQKPYYDDDPDLL